MWSQFASLKRFIEREIKLLYWASTKKKNFILKAAAASTNNSSKYFSSLKVFPDAEYNFELIYRSKNFNLNKK